MALGLALILSQLLLRWPPFGQLVYPIADHLAKTRTRNPWLSIMIALVLTLLVFWLSGRALLILSFVLMLLLFAGLPLRRDGADDVPAQAERLARSIRRYFVPLPFIALLGPAGILLLWWLRFSAMPGRQTVNRLLNRWLAQVVGLHFSLVRQSREALQWSLSGQGGGGSLYAWCLQLLARTQSDITFAQVWSTFVHLRWQWLLLAVLVRWWLG